MNIVGSFKSFHPHISMHILHTVLYTPSKVLTRRLFFLNNQELLWLVIISFILVTLWFDLRLTM